MFLIHMQVTTTDHPAPRGVQVWVTETDSVRAQQLATDTLGAAGWSLLQIDSCGVTSADDYFRPCPSKQAFERAQADTVAWRFDDE